EFLVELRHHEIYSPLQIVRQQCGIVFFSATRLRVIQGDRANSYAEQYEEKRTPIVATLTTSHKTSSQTVRQPAFTHRQSFVVIGITTLPSPSAMMILFKPLPPDPNSTLIIGVEAFLS